MPTIPKSATPEQLTLFPRTAAYAPSRVLSELVWAESRLAVVNRQSTALAEERAELHVRIRELYQQLY
jgi:hypothetical protein